MASLRINDTNRTQYVLPHYLKQASTAETKDQTGAQDSVDVSERAGKIGKLKEMIQSGKPIDTSKLANAMIQHGVLFDERA